MKERKVRELKENRFYVEASMAEYLFIYNSRKRSFINKGLGGSAWFHGNKYVKVNKNPEERDFSFNYDSSDWLPSRLKGAIRYEIIDPVLSLNYYIDEKNRVSKEKFLEKIFRHGLQHLRNDCEKMTFETARSERLSISKTITERLSTYYEEYGLKIDIDLEQIIPKSEIQEIKSSTEIEALKTVQEKEELLREENIALQKIEKEKRIIEQSIEVEKTKRKNTEILCQLDHDNAVKAMTYSFIEKKKELADQIEAELEVEKLEKQKQIVSLISVDTQAYKNRTLNDSNKFQLEIDAIKVISRNFADIFNNSKITYLAGTEDKNNIFSGISLIMNEVSAFIDKIKSE